MAAVATSNIGRMATAPQPFDIATPLPNKTDSPSDRTSARLIAPWNGATGMSIVQPIRHNHTTSVRLSLYAGQNVRTANAACSHHRG
ncbi:hypothetical protein C8J31_10371 [Rhizobium sp. PP-CC-2G-626]|nr:hypothetical protein C8J31_10371 [Rhizobium sp. PP-CC-2G-626]